MEIFVLGTSQSVAPAPLRERLHVEPDRIYGALDELIDEGVLGEAIALVTCGRLEIYAAASEPDGAAARLRAMLAHETGVDPDELGAHSYHYSDSDAVRHLFRVAAGLDSVVHGEAQILGQVRGALDHVSASETGGPRLTRLFQQALRTGKRVRTETEIGQGAASLASAAVSLIGRQFDNLASVEAVVIGAGETGALMGRLLAKAGVGGLTVVNRTEERARDLADQLGAKASPLSALPDMLSDVDLVVGAVAAPERIIGPGTLNGSSAGRGDRPLYLFDLAHPGNFDPALGDVPGVHLFDLEHVFQRVEAARTTRAAHVPRAEAIVSEHMEAFMGRLRSREAAPVLKAIRNRFMDVARTEAHRLAVGNGGLGAEEMTRFARSLARTLLHTPTVALRDADPRTPEGRLLLDSAAVLFGVDESDGGEPG